MDEKRLEQEYRRIKTQEAPDLWSRIEEGLKDHPERTADAVRQKTTPFSMKRIYSTAAVAAAMLALVVVVPKMINEKSDMAGGVGLEADREYANAMPEAEEETVGADDLPDSGQLAGENGDAKGTTITGEAGALGGTQIAGGAGVAEETQITEGAGAAGGNAEAAGAVQGNASQGNAPLGMISGEASRGTGQSQDFGREGSLVGAKKALPEGVLDYRQLKLAAYRPVKVPEDAMTVPEDSRYFSEAILKDTQLLCRGTVTQVTFERDSLGKAVKVFYEMTLDQVYYAEDYTTGMDTITVKSPIVKTDSDEVYILYQLQTDGTYLLPLQRNEGDWELLYPFAPQIQVTEDEAYLFHSGYSSLINDETSVVMGSQEGENDYYYDRMVLRQDDTFLSDLVTLVEH